MQNWGRPCSIIFLYTLGSVWLHLMWTLALQSWQFMYLCVLAMVNLHSLHCILGLVIKMGLNSGVLESYIAGVSIAWMLSDRH